MAMKISFLIVNYFTADQVSELVQSIKKYLSGFSIQILIHDNSCNEEQCNILKSMEDEFVKVFSDDKNIGFTKANNSLYDRSIGDIIVLINPDSRIIDRNFSLIFEFLDKENVGIVGPKLLNEDLSEQIGFFKFPSILSVIGEHYLLMKNPNRYPSVDKNEFSCDVIKGACMAMKRDLVDKIGLFDERFFMYSEEVDLCKRAKMNGYKNYYLPNIKVLHKGRQSTEQKKGFSYYHYIKSKILYFHKYFSNFNAFIVEKLIVYSLLFRAFILFVAGKKNSSKLFLKTYRNIRNQNEDFSIH